MAIQFNCPYCTATIQVGDDAAGKLGRCPKCETRLRVPAPRSPGAPDARNSPPAPPRVTDGVVVEESVIIQVPAEARAPARPDVASGLPIADAARGPVFQPGLRLEEPVFPAAVADEEAAAAETSLARRLQQRRSGGLARLAAPVVCIAVVVGAAGAYWWSQRETMTGELAGERMPPDKAIVGTIRRDDVDAPPPLVASLLRGLQEEPLGTRTDLMFVQFTSSADGIVVTLAPGVEAELVRVNVRSKPAVSAFRTRAAEKLDAPRKAELAEATRHFARDWENAASSGMKLGNLMTYRSSMGLNSLLGGLGYHSTALVGNTVYPCVHEDGEGWLCFLVPRGTRQFVVTERKSEQRPSVFPQEYRFTVNVPAAAAGKSSTAAKPKESAKVPGEEARPDDALRSEAEPMPDAESTQEPMRQKNRKKGQ